MTNLEARVVDADAAAQDLDQRMSLAHHLAGALGDALEIVRGAPAFLHERELRAERELVHRHDVCCGFSVQRSQFKNNHFT